MVHFSSQQIQGHLAQDRQILGAMALANAPIGFTKADSEAPLERVFHAPVLPHGLGKTHGIPGQ
jgi:hypothetical protein